MFSSECHELIKIHQYDMRLKQLALRYMRAGCRTWHNHVDTTAHSIARLIAEIKMLREANALLRSYSN
jgi:hypothetical protein